jgi:nicotinate-nucleotide pyrophosphorylase (carboxylating)
MTTHRSRPGHRHAGDADPRLAEEARQLAALAVAEDLGAAGDVTSRACIPGGRQGRATIVARTPGTLAGLWIAEYVYAAVDGDVRVRFLATDGEAVRPGQALAEVAGPVASLLAGERTVLNFVQRLSGVATLTRQFVDAVAGTRAAICDTRKTTPGWRHLEKYAVRCGGGTNHRMGLWDEVLIKDNHLALCGLSAAEAVRVAREAVGPDMVIEVEVDTLEQFREVLSEKADMILLDNMTADEMAEAVQLRDGASDDGTPLLEASGGVTLSSVAAIARTGVDRISVGALTHSAAALDIAMDVRGGA